MPVSMLNDTNVQYQSDRDHRPRGVWEGAVDSGEPRSSMHRGCIFQRGTLFKLQLCSCHMEYCWASQVVLVVKNLLASAVDSGRDVGSIPGSGKSPGEGNGNPLQYCCLENRIDRGAWQATVHRVAESHTIEETEHA